MRGPVPIKSSRSNMLRQNTAARLALSHMALTGLGEFWTTSNMHAPLRFLSIHLTNQDSIPPIAVPSYDTTHFSQVRKGSNTPPEKRSSETEAQAHRTEYIKLYQLPFFRLQSAASEVPVARQPHSNSTVT